MTWLAFVILFIVLFNFVFETVASILNMGAATPEIPDEFEDVFDRQTYANSQVYLKRKTRMGLFASLVDLIILLVFWFSGGFEILDSFVRNYGQSDLITGLMFFGILAIGTELYKLPFSVYNTFVLEQEFGFNKTSWTTFVGDLIKSLLLTLVLGGPILALILFFFMNAGSLAWLWAWLSVSVITLLLQIVAPTWIMPLFNKFSPLEEGSLRDTILEYAEKVSFPLENLFTMDGSKRSSKSNAFFTGFGKRRRVVFYDTLLEQQTDDELLGVFAHEVGHYKKKHIYIGMIEGYIITGFMFAILGFLLPLEELYEVFFLSIPSVYAGLVFATFLFSPLSFIFSLFGSYLSRKHEYEADEYAITTTGKGLELISALKKLAKTNLANLTPHPFYVKLYYSHPPLIERIDRIRGLSTKLDSE